MMTRLCREHNNLSSIGGTLRKSTLDQLKDGIHAGNRDHYQRFLEEWPWEWAVTLRLNSPEHARAMKQFRNAILRKEGGQVASMGIFIDAVRGDHGRHVHVLMLGRFPDGRLLKDLDRTLYAAHYGMITRTGSKGAVIEEVKDETERRRWAGYLVSPRNTPPGKHELLVPWGRILKTTKLIH
jgi:hypothetical protein